MVNKYVNNGRANIAVIVLLSSILFSSCSKSEKVQPQQMPAAEYLIEDVRYFMNTKDKIDTTKVVLKDTAFYNPGNALNVQKFTADLTKLIKTSRFQLTNLDALPKDVNLDNFSVSVPQNWNRDSYFDLFPEKFPLNQQVNQKPYNLASRSTESITVNVPPRSSIVVNYSISAFYMTCSFSAVLQNKTTGQRYPLAGSWKGLLRYDNSQTNLTQQQL